MSTPAPPNVEALIAALGGKIETAIAETNGRLAALVQEIQSARSDSAQATTFIHKDLRDLKIRLTEDRVHNDVVQVAARAEFLARITEIEHRLETKVDALAATQIEQGAHLSAVDLTLATANGGKKVLLTAGAFFTGLGGAAVSHYLPR